jgi:hypothetical protein
VISFSNLDKVLGIFSKTSFYLFCLHVMEMNASYDERSYNSFYTENLRKINPFKKINGIIFELYVKQVSCLTNSYQNYIREI